jgi:NADPH:quinone reductase-like Zn-dependent oxidoreductase
MRALRYHRYGSPDVLQIDELPEPPASANHARVRVEAVALNPIDWKILAGHVRLLPVFRGPPRGVGFDFAGEIVAIGGGATERHVGERVLGSLLPFGRQGACAEQVVVAYDRVLALPGDIDPVHAAALPIAAGTALQALCDEARVAAGQRVLIIGAAGGVGHFAVQLAKHLGAHVVAVCSARNTEFVRGLGADEVVDYARRDFGELGERFDVVFDAASASSFAKSRAMLTESGCYISTSGDLTSALATAAGAVVARLGSRQRAVAFSLKNAAPVWRRLLDLARKGVLRPHVERTIAMEGVAEALRAMATGHGRGKVVVLLGRGAWQGPE